MGSPSGFVIGVVEDSDEDLFALRRVLGSGQPLRHWGTGEEALRALGEGQINDLGLLFVDCQLPGVDGIEVVRRARRLPGGRNLRIVMLSGIGDASAPARAVETGADRFEAKGDSIVALRSAVARSLALVTDR